MKRAVVDDEEESMYERNGASSVGEVVVGRERGNARAQRQSSAQGNNGPGPDENHFTSSFVAKLAEIWMATTTLRLATMAPGLSLSTTLAQTERTLSSLLIKDSAYVISIVPLETHYAIAATASSDSILLLDKTDCKTISSSLEVGKNKITSLRVASKVAGAQNVLLSSTKNGTVNAWDERTGAVSIQSE